MLDLQLHALQTLLQLYKTLRERIDGVRHILCRTGDSERHGLSHGQGKPMGMRR